MLDRCLLKVLKMSNERDALTVEEFIYGLPVPQSSAFKLLHSLVEKGFLSKDSKTLSFSPIQKVNVAVEAIKLGCELDVVCRYLSWQEFEQIVNQALHERNYTTIHRQVLKAKGRRCEVDIIGFCGSVVLCIDCKHWNYGWKESTIKHVVNAQLNRVTAVLQNIEKIKSKLDRKPESPMYVLPAIVTLTESTYKVYEKVPVVPILKLNSFLDKLYWHLDEFAVEIVKQQTFKLNGRC